MTRAQSIGTAGPAPDGPHMPQPTPGHPFPIPYPGLPQPRVAPTYSALDLMGEVYLGLWGVGKIPAGPMRDPQSARQACAELLRAFGVAPTDEVADVDRAAGAVAAVRGVAA